MEYSADKVPGPEYGSHKGCDEQLTFSKSLKSEQYSLRMKIAYGCILGYAYRYKLQNLNNKLFT